MSDPPTSLTYLQGQIETRRKSLGLSMRALSLKAGLNETAIKAVMQGRSESPRGQTLQAIARALGTSVSELIGESFDPDLPDTQETPPIMAQDIAIEGLRERERELVIEARVLAARLEEVRQMIASLCSATPHATDLPDAAA